MSNSTVENHELKTRVATSAGRKVYPEHAKLLELKDRHEAARDFYDWLVEESGLVLAEYETGAMAKYSRLMPARRRPAELMAKFLGIDEEKLEAEKLQMLRQLRDNQ